MRAMVSPWETSTSWANGCSRVFFPVAFGLLTEPSLERIGRNSPHANCFASEPSTANDFFPGSIANGAIHLPVAFSPDQSSIRLAIRPEIEKLGLERLQTAFALSTELRRR